MLLTQADCELKTRYRGDFGSCSWNCLIEARKIAIASSGDGETELAAKEAAIRNINREYEALVS